MKTIAYHRGIKMNNILIDETPMLIKERWRTNKDKIKDFYPSQIGYRSLNDRTNIARKMMTAFYPEDENNGTQI